LQRQKILDKQKKKHFGKKGTAAGFFLKSRVVLLPSETNTGNAFKKYWLIFSALTLIAWPNGSTVLWDEIMRFAAGSHWSLVKPGLRTKNERQLRGTIPTHLFSYLLK